MSWSRVGAAATLATLAVVPSAHAYELQAMPRLVDGQTVTYHNATAYRGPLRTAVGAINRADVGVRLVPAATPSAANIRIGYLTIGCSGTQRGQAYRGRLQIARRCGRDAARHALLHELGHALGLGHEDARCSVMNSWWVDGKPRRCGRFTWREPLQRDDIAGLRAIWRRDAPAAVRPQIRTRSLTVRAGEPVDFVDATSGVGGWLAEWTFGDGATARGPAARHVFAEPGVYAVRLQIESAGRVSSVAEIVTVLP